MKTATFAKTLSTLALAALALASGSSFAHGYGPHLPDWPAPQAHGSHGPHGGPSFGPGFDRRDDHDRKDVAEVDVRQHRLLERIMDGIANGRLTGEEARKLLREQNRIEFAQRRYLSDGRLDRREWFELDRMLDDAAANIRAEKRDADWSGYPHRSWR